MMTSEADIRRAVGAETGEFPSFAWPGGYPVLYFADDGGTLCASCLNSEGEVHFGGDADGWRVDGWFVHYEGDPEICANCNGVTESAYGPIDEA